MEYRSLNGRYRDDYDFQIDLKTGSDEGIIFYASDPYNQNLIAVYVLDEKVKHSTISLISLSNILEIYYLIQSTTYLSFHCNRKPLYINNFNEFVRLVSASNSEKHIRRFSFSLINPGVSFGIPYLM